MDKLMEMIGTVLGPVAAIGFVLAGYLVITIDRGRVNSPSKDDNQVGLKLVLFGLVIAGIQMAVGGVLMLFVAAILEGGFRQLVQSTPLRFAIGLSVAALWVLYFSLCGRGARR